MIQFRQATPKDAKQIAGVKMATWPEGQAEIKHIKNAMGVLEAAVMVAEAEGRIVGYMACFSTTSSDQQARWEMDELAVHPEFRGQKIAAGMVEQATQIRREKGLRFARALIEINNTASQRTFAHCGYETDGTVYELHICAPFVKQRIAMPLSAHLVPVHTVSYRGLWLEGELSQEAFIAGCNLSDCNVLGALIPADTSHLIEAAAEADFVLVNPYQWWRKTL